MLDMSRHELGVWISIGVGVAVSFGLALGVVFQKSRTPDA